MIWKFKDILLAVVYSWAIMTIINYVLHSVWPQIDIVKSGVAILIFFVGIIISSLVVLTSDGKFDKDDVKGFLVITGVVVALYFGIKFALPDLFSLLPSYTREVFSILG